MVMFSLLFFLMSCAAHTINVSISRARSWIGIGAEAHLVGLVSRKLLRLSAAAASRQSSGNLKTLITSDVRNIGLFMDNIARGLIPAVTALLVIGPLLVHFSGRAGFFGLAIMMGIIPITLGLNAISAHFQLKSQAELDALTSLAGEWVKNIRLIRYLSWDAVFQRDVASGLKRYISIYVIQHFIACLIYGLSGAWWMVSTAGVILIARRQQYPLDLMAFFGSLWLLTFMNGYLANVPNTIRLMGLASPAITRIARLLAEEEQEDHRKPGTPVSLDATPVRMIFERVTFHYPGGKTAIRDLSIEVELDRQLAIVGEVGCGKTTLLRLLCGDIPPTDGNIRIHFNNGEVHDLWSRSAYEAYRRHIAYVPQEAFVSNDLFESNISLSADPADNRENDIALAAYWAELEADLALLPGGLREEIGESGINLSGGQRQRLNLARAFHSRRSYLVLDDTMSAVDTRTENALMERLLARNSGFVLVTHRTAGLMRLEQVVVMKDGVIVERGNPQVLANDSRSHLTRVLRAYEPGSAHG